MNLAFERPEMLWILLLAAPLCVLAWKSKRRQSTLRRVTSLTIRLLILCTITLSLAELTALHESDELAVVFIVDRSTSVGTEGLRQSEAYIDEALEYARPGDAAGVVIFGGQPQVESEVQSPPRFDRVEGQIDPHRSDLAAGVRLGTALLPSDRTRRLVLLSDGEQTRGNVREQARRTHDDSTGLEVVPIGRERGSESWLDDMVSPARVARGATFEVRIIVDSEQPAEGQVRLYRNNAYIGSVPVSLPGGQARTLNLNQQAEEAGLLRFRAVLELNEPHMDSLAQNNVAITTVQVEGRPRILIAEGDPGGSDALAAVLRGDGIEVDIVSEADIPPSLSALRPYGAVFLSDIPAFSLSTRQQEALRAHVRDLGGGLVMLGGDRSFGVGGYVRTPIEDALPVRMDIQDKSRFPSLAMVLAIDKSCSMGGGAGSKLGLAREAAIRTADLLSDRDSLGVIGFDGAASWIAPLRPLTERDQILDDISGLRSGGGTDIYPALNSAIEALNETNAALKHIILISDGQTTPGNYEPLIRQAFDRKITLTSVGIGTDSDSQTLAQFSQWGGGSYYTVTDHHSIPAIFARETLLATRSFLVEETFNPVDGVPSELTRNTSARSIGSLHGYVATEAKARATVGLVVPDDDQQHPLLAHWQFGLGRSVAWTSDAKGRWARDWVGSENYTTLWRQVARWVLGGDSPDNIAVDTSIRSGRLSITADAFDGLGEFQNFLSGEARVIAPDLAVHRLNLQQTGPGRYEAAFPVDQDGSWLVGVTLERDGEPVGQAISEAVQSYSPEFRPGHDGGALLKDLARIGGTPMGADPKSVFQPPETRRRIPQPLWPFLVLAAGFLWLMDVAARRLDWGPPPALSKPATAGAANSRMPPLVTRTGTPETPTTDPDEEDDDYTSRLLKARKKARDKMGPS